LQYQDQRIDLSKPWLRISLAKKFKQATGKNIEQVLTIKAIKNLAKKFGYATDHATWEALFNQIFINRIEPNLPKKPFFLTDFPSKISPLCSPKKEEPHLAERFEFYLAGLELGNGNTEQTNPDIIRQHFQQEQAYRQKNDVTIPQIDQDFLQALNQMNQTNQSYAGIGLGVDRLAMLMADQTKISQINPFTL
jgi:lysyl-tRNA synthetase class II